MQINIIVLFVALFVKHAEKEAFNNYGLKTP